MLKIGITCQTLGALKTGVEVATAALVQELSSRPDVRLKIFITKKGLEVLGEIDPRHDLALLRFDPGRRWRRILWETTELPLLLRGESLDILHGPAYLLPPSCPLPSVVTMHDVIALERPELTRLRNRLYYSFALRWTAKTASKIVASSRTAAAAIRKYLNVREEKIAVIYPGLEPEFEREISPAEIQSVREKYRLTDRYILFLGTLEPKKNLDLIVQAHLLLLRSSGAPTLVLAGSDSWNWSQKSAALRESRTLFPGRVLLPGYLPASDRPALLAGAAGFVFPSLAEGFGLPPLEAMKVGVPVVTIGSPVFHETLGEAPIFSQASTPTALSEALKKSIEEGPARLSLIEKGRQQASKYTWKKHVDQILALYRELLKKDATPFCSND